jgi:hypothetical protein
MLAYKIEPIKCSICGTELPPYLTRNHKVLLFNKEETENLSLPKGEFIEYGDVYPTVNFMGDDSICSNLSHEELDILRQWFNSLEDVHPKFNEERDRKLYEKIMEKLHQAAR